MEITPILKHLGVIRNQLLIFGTLGQLVTHGSGWILDKQVGSMQQAGGIGLHVLGVVIILTFGGFYFYATLKGLPSNPQEFKFEESTEEALENHTQALHKPTKKENLNTSS